MKALPILLVLGGWCARAARTPTVAVRGRRPAPLHGGHPRGRYPVSLAECVVVGGVTVVMMGLAVLIVVVLGTRSERDAARIAECERLGGVVVYDHRMWFDGCRVDGAPR